MSMVCGGAGAVIGSGRRRRAARAVVAIAWCGSPDPVRRLLRSRSGVSRNSRGSRVSNGASGVSGGAFPGGATIFGVELRRRRLESLGRSSRSTVWRAWFPSVAQPYEIVHSCLIYDQTVAGSSLPFRVLNGSRHAARLPTLSSPAAAHSRPGRTPPIEAAFGRASPAADLAAGLGASAPVMEWLFIYPAITWRRVT